MPGCRTAMLPQVALGLWLFASACAAQETPSSASRSERPAQSAPDYIESIVPSPTLQKLVEDSVADIGRNDPKWLASRPRVAVIDLGDPQKPVLGAIRGNEPVYPASVVKFVYLIAAYSLQEHEQLVIDATLDTDLTAMIHQSSNQATRRVFARLTRTEAGPELEPAAYAEFRDRRLSVKRWLETLGVHGLHAVNPTYDGGGDLFGRDEQFLRDKTVVGGLPSTSGSYSNRQAMTATSTAQLLALLATGRVLTPEGTAAVRKRMHRDLKDQPYLVHRIAGVTASIPGTQVDSKSGTWGPIYADAGLVRGATGGEFAIAVFTEASPPYRGDAIAELTRRVATGLFASPRATGQGDGS